MSYAIDVDEDISITELEFIEAKFANEKSRGAVSENTQFLYAWALIRSKFKDDRLLGIQEFEEIIKQYPERARECNYFLAAANYKIGKYRIALKHVNTVLLIEPENLQALDLKEKIENKLTNDGIIGLAVAGGLAAAVTGFLMVMYRSKRK